MGQVLAEIIKTRTLDNSRAFWYEIISLNSGFNFVNITLVVSMWPTVFTQLIIAQNSRRTGGLNDKFIFL